MTPDWCWLLPLLIVCLLGLTWSWQRCQHSRVREIAVTATVQRLLKPRTPDDCPSCRQLATTNTLITAVTPPIRPWRERKSRRGAPKRINTDGFACPTRSCVYYRMSHVQRDELRTRLRSRAQTRWLWLAVDPLSKIIPVLHLGSRTQVAAHIVVHDLRQQLAPV